MTETRAEIRLPTTEIRDDLPRNTMGKVQKKLLRDQLAGVFAAS